MARSGVALMAAWWRVVRLSMQLSIRTRPRWLGRAGWWILDMRQRRASGSVLERWLSSLSLMARKSCLTRFLPGFGGPDPSPAPQAHQRLWKPTYHQLAE